MTYDLRRLRPHRVIKRIPKTQRYRVTEDGLRAALFFTRTYNRILRRGLSAVLTSAKPQRVVIARRLRPLAGAVNT